MVKISRHAFSTTKVFPRMPEDPTQLAFEIVNIIANWKDPRGPFSSDINGHYIRDYDAKFAHPVIEEVLARLKDNGSVTFTKERRWKLGKILNLSNVNEPHRRIDD